ncbi:MAG: TMEM175 family protein [Lactobacillaceae bacterium]|jgi:uncharacterized membrane protein|nr:TMEM175 family protein [Lactobacillaceae bacterium]
MDENKDIKIFNRNNGEFINNRALTKRLNNFIDSVLSIIATIMILQIKLPVKPQNLNDFWPTLVSISVYLLSFFIVMNFYLSTVRVFSRIVKLNGLSILLIFLWMGVLSLMPFFSSWLITEHDSVFAITSYGILYVITSGLHAMLVNVVIKTNRLPESNSHTAQDILIAEIYNYMFAKKSILQFIMAILIVVLASSFPKVGIWILIAVPIIQLVENALDGSDFNEKKMSDKQINFLIKSAKLRLRKRKEQI